VNLTYPTEKVSRSIRKHNSDLIIVADWLELGLLVFDPDAEGMSIPDCVDLMVEGHIYESQDFCREFFDSVFGELRERQSNFGNDYPLTFASGGLRLIATGSWRDSAALTFCLLLSALPNYSGYSEWVAGHYVEQGELFERVSAAAFAQLFPEWDVMRTGWNGGDGVVTLDSLMTSVADATDEVVRTEAAAFVGVAEKDLGVDVAAVRRFTDRRASLPTMFAQCASGRDWPKKLATPDTSRWKQLVTFTHSPLKSLALPFRLTDDEYRQRRSQCKGLLMDRFRLLPQGDESWLEAGVRDALVAWIEPRIEWLNEHYSA
jgi:hypothetical protein